jgi:hypothetical protein
MITEVEGTADESFPHVGSADMDLEIPGLGESLGATKIRAGYLLSLLQGLPRMLTVNMVLQLSLTGALEVAKWTIGMLFFDVRLELRFCSKAEMNGRPIWAEGSRDCALRAEELGSSMNTLFVLSEAYCTIKSSIAGLTCDRINVGTGIRSELEVF